MGDYSSCASRVQRYRTVHTNDMPVVLLAMYFVIAWTQAFPDTAYNIWLNQVLEMPLATQSDFYAFVFLPTMMKPVFGFLSDRFPICGSHRRSYIIICSLGSSAMYMITALWVDSVPLAFCTTFLRAGFTSFAELMLGALLIEVVHKDPVNAGSIQSLAITVRSLGSMSAMVCGLAFYTCESTTTPAAAKRIIATAGLFPLLNVMFACFLGANAKNKHLKETASKTVAGEHDKKVVLFMLLCQAVFIWIGLKSFIGQSWFVEDGDWWHILAGMIAFIALMVLLCAAYMKRKTWKSNPEEAKHAAVGISHQSSTSQSASASASACCCTALFFFLYNATPGAGVQLYSYELSLFSSRICYMQFLSIAGSASRCVAGILYGASQTVTRDNTIKVLIATTILSSAASLLTLPLLPSVGFSSIYSSIDHAFAYDLLTTCLVSVLSYMAFIPLVVLATQSAAAEHFAHFNEISEELKCNENEQNAKAIDYEMGFEKLDGRAAGEPEPKSVEREVDATKDALSTRPLLVRQDSADSGVCTSTQPRRSMNTALLYGLYLSFIDFGDSAGGWISSDIVTRLGITYGGWDALWKLLVIGVVAKVLALLFVPLLLVGKRQGATPQQ
jgi:hypothetical protein